ncbi:MAG TPA: glycoside hydrolase family 9 protein [Gemmatimonadaceae bacterium]
MKPQRAGTLAAIFLACVAPLAAGQGAAPAHGAIRMSQIGFLPTAPKIAVVVGATGSTFAVVAERGDTVLRGILSTPRSWALSGEEGIRRADFTRITKPGRYRLVVPGAGAPVSFDIGTTHLHDLARATLKGFYFQRSGVPIDARYAGKWARAEGHPDTAVLVHPSAASASRPAGTKISSPLGWYDAGDYNKYVVNSGISTYTLLLLAEQFPEYAVALRTDVPESGNALPDVLDEALFNVRWMRTMQDPADGGVYHKLTNAEFDAFEEPRAATQPRYVVQKSTAATLDFAAVMAQASRVVRRYPRELPGLADSLSAAALAAWRWARQHPDSLYDQNRLNAATTPHVNTGAYGDRNVDDERRWAAAELYLATRQDSFLVAVSPLQAAGRPEGHAPFTLTDYAIVPGWPDVGTLALVSLAEHRRELPPSVNGAAIVDKLVELARSLRAVADSSPYAIAMGSRRDFVWGSNAVAANQGLVLVQAYRLTGDTTFLRAALGNLDYILGRNPTGYSFVTGVGTRTPMFPHHRLSASDTVAAPVPGLLVGGPNPGQQDHCSGYPSSLPALSYLDAQCSYASNEIAINWNAPIAYLSAAIDAAYGSGHPVRGAAATTKARPYVVVVSLDAFRSDYLAKYRPASLERLAKRGIVARGLVPPFPSKTFPSHYTLATGLYPGHHGILSNNFYDPALERWFRLKDTSAVRDGRWFGGVPIWVAAQREGLRSSVYFWPGSEGVVAGERPTYWSSYRASVPDSCRIDESIARLRLPAAERPHLEMIYLTDVDDTTHHYGPDTPHTANAVASLDRALTRLLDSLDALPQRDSVNVVVLSDHGMYGVSQERMIPIRPLLAAAGIDTMQVEFGDSGPVMSLWFHGDTALTRRTLAALAHVPHMHAYARGETPPRWHLAANARAGDVLIVADLGYLVARSATDRVLDPGNHGWDPTFPAMHGVFVAAGPQIRAAGTLPEVENVNVYPFLAALLGLQHAPSVDGKLGVLAPYLRAAH